VSANRQAVLASAEELVAEIEPGATIGIGGLLDSSHPMALLRALVRRGVGDLHVVGTAQGFELDWLIAAGLVRKVTVATISGDTLGMIAPAFRREAEAGGLEVAEADEGLMYAALLAAAHQIDFMPWGAGLGTSIPELNDGIEIVESPFGGRPTVAVKALPLDFALLHAARSDPFGNVQYVGGAFGDRALARAAARVFVSVDEVVSNREIRTRPQATAYSGVDAVVHAPFGSHPFASPGRYIHDEPVLREYLEATGPWLKSGDRGALDEFLRRWLVEPGGHWEYLDRVGSERLNGLAEALHSDELGGIG
jgi:glutaconate CoA-transferase subunit A